MAYDRRIAAPDTASCAQAHGPAPEHLFAAQRRPESEPRRHVPPLVVSRERTRHFDPEAALRIETASKHGVHLHKVLADHGQEVRLYCFSEARAAKERGIVERFAQRFETALTELSEGLSWGTATPSRTGRRHGWTTSKVADLHRFAVEVLDYIAAVTRKGRVR